MRTAIPRETASSGDAMVDLGVQVIGTARENDAAQAAALDLPQRLLPVARTSALKRACSA